jgi:hypothetical protein
LAKKLLKEEADAKFGTTLASLTHATVWETFDDYQMFVGQDPIKWEDLPNAGMILIPRIMPPPSRQEEFHIKDPNATPAPRSAGPLIQAKWQLFTNEKYPFNEPVPVVIPEEITLAQLVAHHILPAEFDNLDSNAVFKWSLKVSRDKTRSGTKKRAKQIPGKFHAGQKLGVMASSLHTDSDRKQVTCTYGAAKIRFSFLPGETIATSLLQSSQKWLTEGKEISGI